MRKQAIISLGALSLAASAQASLETEVRSCAARGDAFRLECYDKLAERHGLNKPKGDATAAPVAAPAPQNRGKWIVRDHRNPIDDTRTVALILDADSGIGRYGDVVDVVVRCQSNRTEMYINWYSYLGMDGTRVTSRVGDAKAESRTWHISSDNKGSFYPGSPISLLKSMMEAERFVAQVTPYGENPVTATFDVRGLKDAIAPLRETCKW